MFSISVWRRTTATRALLFIGVLEGAVSRVVARTCARAFQKVHEKVHGEDGLQLLTYEHLTNMSHPGCQRRKLMAGVFCSAHNTWKRTLVEEQCLTWRFLDTLVLLEHKRDCRSPGLLMHVWLTSTVLRTNTSKGQIICFVEVYIASRRSEP